MAILACQYFIHPSNRKSFLDADLFEPPDAKCKWVVVEARDYGWNTVVVAWREDRSA